MFIYCGDCEDGGIRVLDTEDGIVEEVDKIQLKVLQSQGYTVKKDFSYDYAHELILSLRSGFLTNYSIALKRMYRNDIDYILAVLEGLDKKFKLGLRLQQLSSCRICWWLVSSALGVYGIFISGDRIRLILINKYGIIRSRLLLKRVLPSIDCVFDYKSSATGTVVIRLKYYRDELSSRKDIIRFFHIDKFGHIEEHSSHLWDIIC